MDSHANPTAEEQRGVRRIDDGVNRQRGDVGMKGTEGCGHDSTVHLAVAAEAEYVWSPLEPIGIPKTCQGALFASNMSPSKGRVPLRRR